MSRTVFEPTMVLPMVRRRLTRAALSAASCAVWAVSSWGADLTFSSAPNAAIPDGNFSGLVSTLDVPLPSLSVLDVDLTLNVRGVGAGGWNGDLYAFLAHDGELSVLLNRPGRAAANPFGYGGNGLDGLTFDDEAALGDIHLYEITLGFSNDVLPLGGTWVPDARGSDPAVADVADPRGQFLDQFDGLDAEGEWRLFIADVSPGGSFVLESWQIQLSTSGVIIPETRTGVVGSGAVLFALTLAGWRFARRARDGRPTVASGPERLP